MTPWWAPGGAAQRTACTKNVGEVAGTNKKPGGKGTGRARAGSFRSPLWRGARRFRAAAAGFSKTISRATKQLALRKA